MSSTKKRITTDSVLDVFDPPPNDDRPASPACERACAWLDKVKDMLREKNRAYGDSVAEPMGVFSRGSVEDGIRVRIDDKLKRIAKGDGSGNEDAVKDLVGYLAFLATVGDQ
jgi:hypothetical protein